MMCQPKAAKMKSTAFLILFFSVCSRVYGGQVCEAVLPHELDTKRSKVGDHIILRTTLFTALAESPITSLDASIVEVRPKVKGSSSILWIRVNKAMRKDGHELPVEARIVAVISKSRVTESWEILLIIADRFPRLPEDDQREPGERKLSEDKPHTSPLDSLPDVPILHRVVCPEKRKKGTATCLNLLDARGIYGYKAATLQPPDPALPTESVLTSEKNMSFRAGTVVVLEVKNIH
jgi:hypothetical protein